ncbi:polyprenyl diphosphate synthase [Chloroflexota bacterium]
MATPSTTKKVTQLPNHVAVIMDGNGRWAEQRGLLRLEGHRVGAKNIRPIIECLIQCHVKNVTLYGFSTENWNRPEHEVGFLFQLLEELIDEEVSGLHKKGVKIHHLGRLEELPQGVQLAINRAVELTKDNTGTTFGFAFNYGGRMEIVDAVRRIVAEGIPVQNIDEGLFNSYLYTAGLPDVDLLIRTGGEIRISNFLLWQAAYSEYYFTDILWPDFNQKELEKALLAYSKRRRRFGNL